MKYLLIGLMALTTFSAVASDICVGMNVGGDFFSWFEVRCDKSETFVIRVLNEKQSEADQHMEERRYKKIGVYVGSYNRGNASIYVKNDSPYAHAKQNCMVLEDRREGLAGWLSGYPIYYSIDCGKGSLIKLDSKAELTKYLQQHGLKKAQYLGRYYWGLSVPSGSRYLTLYQGK